MNLKDGLILAIDMGSSSIRGGIFDSRGNLQEGTFVQKSYAENKVEIRQMITLMFLCFALIDEIMQKVGNILIDRVAIDTFATSLVGSGSTGNPTTGLYTWADTSGAEFADELSQKLDPQKYINRTGCRLHPSYWPVRLLSLQQENPSQFAAMWNWYTVGSLLFNLLFQIDRISLSDASWTGLLNRFTNAWDEETLAHLPIKRKQLPTISDEPLQGLPDSWANRWPQLKDALWYPPVADGVASNIGAACVSFARAMSPARVAISVGTSGAMRIIVPGRPEKTPDGLFAYCVDQSQSLIGGALSNAGNLYAWMKNTFKLNLENENLAAALDPDSHGLTILPFLAGERAPGWNPNAQAVLMGMTTDTHPEHLLRAGLEAISYRFYQIAERLASLMPDNPIYIASGGAITGSPLLMQIMADVLNCPVYANAAAETTIRGAVYLASGYEPEPQLGAEYLPDASRHAIYQAGAERQQKLYQRLFEG